MESTMRVTYFPLLFISLLSGQCVRQPLPEVGVVQRRSAHHGWHRASDHALEAGAKNDHSLARFDLPV